MIRIFVYKKKIWGDEFLSKKEMKMILEECLKVVNLCAKDIFLNVNFVDAILMAKYNFDYCGKNSSTNVLSFENKSNLNFLKENKLQQASNKKILFLGEIVLCYENIYEEANKFCKQFKDRLYHLFVHGVFHLLGFNHINETERKQMESLEAKVLLKFGIHNPYWID